MFAPSSIKFIPSGPSSIRAGKASPKNTAVRSTALILIPARNEAATIGHVVRGCVTTGFSVLVIDDASRDDTALLAEEAGAKVRTLSGPHHGKTAALHHAMARLPDNLEWLLFLDGDGQHPPADLERF